MGICWQIGLSLLQQGSTNVFYKALTVQDLAIPEQQKKSDVKIVLQLLWIAADGDLLANRALLLLKRASNRDRLMLHCLF